MFLKKDKRPNGRLYLSIVRGFRDPITKKNKQKAVKSIGFYDELIKEFDDPIAHFTEVAKKMTEEEKENEKFEVSFYKSELMDTKTNDIKNIGFAVLSKIYHELDLHKFLINRERTINYKYPLNNIMKLLVFSRILNPSSKLSTFDSRNMYVENFDFKLEHLYRSLKVFSKYKDDLLLDLHENINMLHPRDTSNVFYDVTNYYFHTDTESSLIKKGYSKDRKGKPIVQMGLLMDNNSIPITYKLFEGNTSDFNTLLPILSEVKREFNLKRVIVVADKGLNSGTNKAYNIIKGDGYIFSRSLRGKKANTEEKEYALSDEGYVQLGDEYKLKSRVISTKIWVEDINSKRKQVEIDEKHIVFYSDKYARRAKHKRNKLIEKAKKLIALPSMYESLSGYGALKYIEGLKLDKDTGELIAVKKGNKIYLNEELIREEERFDGYYSIVTSELDMADTEVIERYRGLWKIEETFKVSKSVINARPVWVWTEDSIEAHFLSCFISLLILRLLEKETGGVYSIDKMIDSLKKANVCLLDMNNYKAVYYDEVLEHIDKCLGTKLNRKYLTLSDLKKIVSDTK